MAEVLITEKDIKQQLCYAHGKINRLDKPIKYIQLYNQDILDLQKYNYIYENILIPKNYEKFKKIINNNQDFEDIINNNLSKDKFNYIMKKLLGVSEFYFIINAAIIPNDNDIMNDFNLNSENIDWTTLFPIPSKLFNINNNNDNPKIILAGGSIYDTINSYKKIIFDSQSHDFTDYYKNKYVNNYDFWILDKNIYDEVLTFFYNLFNKKCLFKIYQNFVEIKSDYCNDIQLLNVHGKSAFQIAPLKN